MLFVHTPVRCGTFVAEADTSGPSARLYYEMHGEADIEHTRRRIVLVNGVSQSCRMWGLALNYLKDGASQIVVFDNRGVGDSDQSSDALRAPTMTRFGADIAALISHLHWDAHTDRIPLFLIGFSMGGMAALQAVSRMPSNTLKGLALINTSAGGWWNLLPSIPLLWILLKAALGLIPVKTQCDLIKFMILRTFPQSWLMASPPPKSIYSGYSTNGEFISRYILERSTGKTKQTVAGRRAQTRAVATHFMSPADLRAVGLKTRVTVFVGMQDIMIRPSNSRYLWSRIPGAKFIAFPQAGHALFEQEHERFHKELLMEVFGNTSN